MPRKRPLVDEKVFELAQYFFLDYKTRDPDKVWELADLIQQTIEGFFMGEDRR
jgi:hypothetical protein